MRRTKAAFNNVSFNAKKAMNVNLVHFHTSIKFKLKSRMYFKNFNYSFASVLFNWKNGTKVCVAVLTQNLLQQQRLCYQITSQFSKELKWVADAPEIFPP